ncbi:MAG: zinc ribbon domain-containing protein, partial [Candidatus Micrarchaeaceae archaeon]
IKKGKERLALNDRTYHCNVCNLIMDRDLNSSIVILKRGILARGRAGPARTDAQGDICQYNAKGIASSVGELRTYPAIAGEAHIFSGERRSHTKG